MLATSSSSEAPRKRSFVPISRNTFAGSARVTCSRRFSTPSLVSPPMPRLRTRRSGKSSSHGPPSVMLSPRKTMSSGTSGKASKALTRRAWCFSRKEPMSVDAARPEAEPGDRRQHQRVQRE